MILLLTLIILSLICIFLIFAYVKSRIQSQQIKRNLKTYQSDLENTKGTENHLRQELTQLQNKLSEVKEDPLTKLLGWQLFEDRLKQHLLESHRYQLTMGVLMVDIDDFKMINNALSYEMGDAVLQEVAKRLQSCIRQVDCVSRFAKDTFVILLSQLGKPEAAAIVAQRILQSLEEPIYVNEHELFITACVGIAIYPTDGQDAASLLRNCDTALHSAKEKGKKVYQFYHEKTHLSSQRELALATGLHRESISKEFVIYYQPVFEVNNKKIICMDALLNWQHANLGLIKSKELFSYAEKQNKLHVISEWLLQNACRQFLYWRTLDFTPDFLSIPLPIKLLENSHFVYRISQVLQELHFKPEWILFVIEGHQNAFSFDQIEKAFNMLKYLNVRLALDSFGTHQFSLHDLKKITVNALRLEPLFIDDIETNTKTKKLIESILHLANNLGMQLVVQGVTSNNQFNILKELGCTLLQGPLLSEPLSEKEVAKKMTVS